MPTPVTHLSDFPDRLSPMLVKELRQGLRAKTFIVLFLALQIFLAVMLLSAGVGSNSDHVGSVISGIIFTFFAVAVLVVQPLRGTGALSSEVKGNTIDMMVLTRLSAWRIVYGKWVAIVGQSALLFTTIIPYLILRYFFGGMNLFAEILCLVLIFLTSMALTAVTVGLSGCSSVIVRGLLPVLGLPIALWMMMVMFLMRGMGGSSDFMGFFSLDSTESRIGVAAYVLSIAYIGGSLLSLGASLIAPAAENHAIIRRLVTFGLLIGLLVLWMFDVVDKEVIGVLALVISPPAIIIALTESAQLVQPVCKPFVKRGPIGKAVGWLLYPCWESGVLFAILTAIFSIAIIFGTAMRNSGYWNTEEAVVILAIAGGLFFPAVWQVFFFRGDGQRFAHYLLLLVGSYVMLGILASLAASMNSSTFLWFFTWNPLAFIPLVADRHQDRDFILTLVSLVDVLLMVILLARVFIEIRKSATVIRETEASLKKSV
jgi:hypothetical protein